MPEIKAIVFDAGGVLHESNSAMNDDLQRTLGMSRMALLPELELLGAGSIDEAEFWHLIAEKHDTCAVQVEENLLGRAFAVSLKPHKKILKTVEELHGKGIITAVLSNTIEPHAAPLRATGVYDRFDYVILSHEVGMRKPHAEIYRYTLRLLQANPEATVFIDDDPVNIAAAEARGITGILFDTEDDITDMVAVVIACHQSPAN